MADKAPVVLQAANPLRYNRCGHCGHTQAGAAPHCVRCGHMPLESATSQGNGTIVTFTTVHRAPSAAFRQLVPYTLVLVRMDEGFQRMLHLRATTEPGIGQRIRVLVQDGELPVAEFL